MHTPGTRFFGTQFFHSLFFFEMLRVINTTLRTICFKELSNENFMTTLAFVLSDFQVSPIREPIAQQQTPCLACFLMYLYWEK